MDITDKASQHNKHFFWLALQERALYCHPKKPSMSKEGE
jgi:hypothetical protein